MRYSGLVAPIQIYQLLIAILIVSGFGCLPINFFFSPTMTLAGLNKQKVWPWIGDLKSRISREMPPQKAIRYKTD